MTHHTRSRLTKFIHGSATGALLLSSALLAGVPALAAEPPAAVETIEMSNEVATALNAVIAAMDAQDYAAATTALQQARATLYERMSDYEKLRMLQLSANLNALMQQRPEAIADYAAILQMPALGAAERLTASKLIAELYLQQADWNKAVEHLLVANAQEGGNRETLTRIAYAYGQLGLASQAVPYMEQALALAGAAAGEGDYNNMALLYINANDNARAIATYEKLLEIAPDTANREAVSANLAALYIKVGSTAKAQSMLRTLIREFPSSSQVATYRQSLSALTPN